MYKQITMVRFAYFSCFMALISFISCNDEPEILLENQWDRSVNNPVFRDFIPAENYQTASDPHVFYDENDSLRMIYTGDDAGFPAIKLASGSSLTEWKAFTTLLFEIGPSNLDKNKETAFYRKTDAGKHQLYYIGYPEESTYESQIFLAEADELTGPYQQMDAPIIPRGEIAGEEVYCMTSPSVHLHDGKLYMSFIGWDAAPNKVTEVWVMGAISEDDGKTWSDIQKVDTRIGMEGQVTKINDNEYVATRTGDYRDKEAIFYATATHPFGPWDEQKDPILVQQEDELEKNQVIAPQITLDPSSGKEFLFYTGADYEIGWWVMMAENNQ